MQTQLVVDKTYHCGLIAALDVVGGRWKVFILWYLHPDAKRFGELKRLVPKISEKMLIQQLRELEADGIVMRRDYQTVPLKVEYSLTELGIRLKEVLKPLCEWGSDYMDAVDAQQIEGAGQKKQFRKERQKTEAL